MKALVLTLGVLAASLLQPALAQDPPQLTRPPQAFGPSLPIPGHYIVVFKRGVNEVRDQALALARSHGGQVEHVYTHALQGFAAKLPDAAVRALKHHPLVDYIEPDRTVSLQETPVANTQYQATWGLDRIDQVTRPLDGLYHNNYRGVGSHAFIIDTGIRADHSEFTGRILPGFNVAPDSSGATVSSNTSDCNGHGTHVAGTVGGTLYGVAKGATLIPVRVLNCQGSGTTSGVIAGINWVAGSSLRPAVANLSLGMSGVSTAVNAAVAGAVSKGVSMVVAAGNDNKDACGTSPASEASAVTVGATDSKDARARYSNYGTCLDLFAPGSSITSAWYSTATAAAILSGTSMAAPHVTGVVALALAANPDADPVAIDAFLKAYASANQLSAIGTGSPNLLVYSLADQAPTPIPIREVAVKSLTAASTSTRSGWNAGVDVAVRDVGNGAAVANATVSGSFDPGGSKSCVTNSSGSCRLISSKLKLTVPSSTFTVTGISGTNPNYDSSQNAATDLLLTRP